MTIPQEYSVEYGKERLQTILFGKTYEGVIQEFLRRRSYEFNSIRPLQQLIAYMRSILSAFGEKFFEKKGFTKQDLFETLEDFCRSCLRAGNYMDFQISLWNAWRKGVLNPETFLFLETKLFVHEDKDTWRRLLRRDKLFDPGVGRAFEREVIAGRGDREWTPWRKT